MIESAAGRGTDAAPHGGPDPDSLPPEVKLLGAVSLAQDTGSEMLYPLLPTFITGVLGAPVVAVGVAEGLADAVAAGMKLVAGRLAHAQRRKRWIALGYGLAAIGKIIVAAAFVWPVVIVGRVVDRIGKGTRGVPRDALIADAVPTGKRGRAFGFHRSLDTLGAVIGPLIAVALLHLLDGRIRPILALAVVPAVLSVALVAWVREPAAAVRPTTHDDVHATRLPGRFWRVLAPLAAFAVVNSTDALLLQRASEIGLDVTEVVLVYVTYNIVYASLAYPAGRLADRIAPRAVYATGLVVFAAVYLAMGTTTSSLVVWIALPGYGAFTALTDGVGRAWIADITSSEQRTWALGVHGATTGVGVLIAGLWSGLAWRGTGRLPLTVSGIVALGIAGWMLLAPGSGREPSRFLRPRAQR